MHKCALCGNFPKLVKNPRKFGPTHCQPTVHYETLKNQRGSSQSLVAERRPNQLSRAFLRTYWGYSRQHADPRFSPQVTLMLLLSLQLQPYNLGMANEITVYNIKYNETAIYIKSKTAIQINYISSTNACRVAQDLDGWNQ